MPQILAHREPDVKEIHVLWMTSGLGCDGDSVSITAQYRRRRIRYQSGDRPANCDERMDRPTRAKSSGDCRRRDLCPVTTFVRTRNNEMRMAGEFHLLQSDFGIERVGWSSPFGGQLSVKDEVTLAFDLAGELA